MYGSETFRKVVAWFEARSPKGAHTIGALYTGTFFYDAYFWKVSVPVSYGTNQVNLLDLIPEMPALTKEKLKSQREMLTEFAFVGVDCVDYAYGTDDIQHGGTTVTLPLFAKQLASSADGYLRGTVDLLCNFRVPNPRAMETASLATEMFLKSYLATHVSLDETGAKRLGHHLDDIIKECIHHSNSLEMKNIAQLIPVFPDVNARYEGIRYESPALWNAYAAAQQAGVAFVRSVTDRDIAMADLIVGSKEVAISEVQARGIAIFAFKTAVVAEHMKRDRQRFYSREIRHEFAKTLNIPRNIQMWMAGFLPMGSGHIHSCYHDGKIDSINRIEMHVCTYSVGHLTFQVVSARCTLSPLAFRPMQGFDHLAAQFWPTMPVPIRWPPNDVLRTKEDWERFSNRWRKISPP